MTAPISAEIPIIGPEAPPPRPVIDSRRRPAIHIDLAATSSFETFYRDQRDSIARALSLTIGDADQAAESTDEAMIRAYQQWSKVSSYDQPAAWVYRVGLNHSRSRFRRVARKLKHVAHLGRDSAVHHDDHFTDRIGDDKMAKALFDLSDDHRTVVVVRVLLGFSEAEAAQILSVRPGTVKSRLHRALGQLREALPHLAGDIDRLDAPDPTNPSDPSQ